MDILWIIAVGIAGLIIISLILPWINFSQIRALQREIQRLQESQIRIKPETEIKLPENIVQPMPPITPKINIPETVIPDLKSLGKKSKINFEQQFGARLPVWIGGIAMTLAGFFLVKYSIEAGLLTEKVRISLGLLFGLILLYSGNWVRSKPAFANGTRIAQAFTGAGIADLYACSFAATSLYHLVPIWIGFIAMALITTIAIILSLRHGPPIALMGLLGGLLTPLLINSGTHNTVLLFTYLYLVIAGLLIVIRQKNWWILFFPAIIGIFLWVIFWVFFRDLVPNDCLYLNLFLIALSITFVFSALQHVEETILSFRRLAVVTLCGAIGLMAIVGFKSQYDLQTWSLFGLLAAGSIVLAYFKQQAYSFLPWVLMSVNAVMLFTWHGAAAPTIASVIIIFAVIYNISGCCLLWRSQKPLQWAGLAGVCSVVYYLIGYHQLHAQYSSIIIWGGLAIGLAVLAIIMASKILGAFNSDRDLKQKLLTIFVLTATTFLSLSLAIIFKQKLLPIAFAAQLLVISWINTKVDIKILRKISILLTGVFILLLLPQIRFFINLLIDSLQMSLFNSVLSTDFSIVNSPVFQLGLPGLLLGIASVFFRKEREDNLVKFLEISCILLLGLMGYCLFRYIYHNYASYILGRASFTERGIITDLILLYSLICIWTGRVLLRQATLSVGLILFGIGLSRIIYFDLVLYNPFLTKEYIGSTPVFNALILTYGLPLMGILGINKIKLSLDLDVIKKYLNIINNFGLILLFIYITFNIRQFYQGEYLNGASTSNAEIYTYSIGWLLMGIGLLLAGTLKRHKFIRIASLVVMMLTVGKVFLYDASALTGLYRVFSFFGLGLSLIALSWFYTRFVFNKHA